MPPQQRQPSHQKPSQQARVEVSGEDRQTVNRFIEETDWTDFWSRVTERTSVEVEAYEKARVKSLQTAAQHVFV